MLVDSEKPDVSTATKRNFAAITVGYYRSIRAHRDEESLVRPARDDEHGDEVDMWETADVHWLPDALGKTTTVRERSSGLNSTSSTREVPLIDRISIAQIEAVAYELDDLSKKLGFTEQPRESHHRTVIDDDLMDDVEEWKRENLNDGGADE